MSKANMKSLEEGLRLYKIGEKLKALRLRRKMGLVELGTRTGISPALLSRIERSRSYPTLPTLLRAASVFGVGLEHFFSDRREAEAAIARKEERLSLPAEADDDSPPFHFECLDFRATNRAMNCYFAEFHDVAHEAQARHAHDGAELIYVIAGRLEIEIGSRRYILGTGDAARFDPAAPHSYRKIGKGPCTAVVITSP